MKEQIIELIDKRIAELESVYKDLSNADKLENIIKQTELLSLKLKITNLK